MPQALLFSLLGYLSGSVLYAKLFPMLTGSKDASLQGSDQNPGVFNAFKYGSFSYGLFTLLGDIFKALIPVFAYMRLVPEPLDTPWASLVIAAPVIGHLFPIFWKFKGGKGIAASFGSLLGLFPIWQPAVALAILFLFFTCVIAIKPHYYLTLVVYLLMIPVSFLLPVPYSVIYGIILMCVSILYRLYLSREERAVLEVSPAWKR